MIIHHQVRIMTDTAPASDGAELLERLHRERYLTPGILAAARTGAYEDRYRAAVARGIALALEGAADLSGRDTAAIVWRDDQDGAALVDSPAIGRR